MFFHFFVFLFCQAGHFFNFYSLKRQLHALDYTILGITTYTHSLTHSHTYTRTHTHTHTHVHTCIYTYVCIYPTTSQWVGCDTRSTFRGVLQFWIQTFPFLRLVVIQELKSPICPTICPLLEGELLETYLSLGYWHYVKC